MLITGHEEKTAEYYSDVYSRGYSTSGYYPLYRAVLNVVKGLPSARILELGCGIGDLGKMIIEAGYSYRGFDFSEEAIAQCHKLCPGGNFQVGNVYDAEAFLPPDYNVIIALEVLEHVDDLKVIGNIPPGVRLIASVPDYDDVAHLRLYRDVKKDIIEYYAPYMQIVEVGSATGRNNVTGAQQRIYLFQGIRILS